MTSLTSFSLFANLPAELQRMCWEWAFYAVNNSSAPMTSPASITFTIKGQDHVDYPTYCLHSRTDVCEKSCFFAKTTATISLMNILPTRTVLPQWHCKSRPITNTIKSCGIGSKVFFSDMAAFSNLYMACTDSAIASLGCLCEIIRIHGDSEQEYITIRMRIRHAWYNWSKGLVKYETQPEVLWLKNYTEFTKYYYAEEKWNMERRAAGEKVPDLTLPEVDWGNLIGFEFAHGRRYWPLV